MNSPLPAPPPSVRFDWTGARDALDSRGELHALAVRLRLPREVTVALTAVATACAAPHFFQGHTGVTVTLESRAEGRVLSLEARRSQDGAPLPLAELHEFAAMVPGTRAEAREEGRVFQCEWPADPATEAEAPAAATDGLSEAMRLDRVLLHTMQQLRQRGDELARVNRELNETNSGVLALYDELETLHRVGMMLAERHHLHDLVQTIIDATTDLAGAEVGAFYYHEAGSQTWRMDAVAGPRANSLGPLPTENPADFFGPAGLTHETVRLERVEPLAEGHPCEHWLRLLQSRGEVNSCLFVPILGADGQLTGALLFAHRRAQTFTERSERIVSAIAVQAAIGIEKARLFHGLQTASEAKDRFFAMLSHELRTPLNPVAAILSSLAHDPTLPAHLLEDVTVMKRNIELEARLIDDLLDFNRIVRGKFELHRAPVDVHHLIRSAVAICQADIEAHRHRLELRLMAAQSTVAGDGARLQQVLWNLLNNAVKFTPEGGRIVIHTLEAPGGRLRIEVVDSGRGIAPEALAGIFSAFDQGQLRPGGFGGLGLGLAIAKTFVESHGGSVTGRSDGLGQGSTFTVELPLVPEAELAAQAGSPRDTSPTAAGRHCHILLVEDHVDTLHALARLLRRRGHEVATATSCAEALELAAHDVFDLVATDLGLPDGSGHDLLRSLRHTQRAPAIALSGYGMESDLANSRAAGFSRHLTKPVSFAQLEQAIEQLCD